jgi:hypothetical protein
LSDLIAEYLGITPQRGDEWTITCPHPDHSDRRPSASIYVGEPMVRQRGGAKYLRLPGMWICYSCHASGRISNEGIENYEPTADRNLDVALANLENVEQRVYPESWLDLWEYPGGVHPYWLARFGEATCRRHRLGYDFERNSGTYPLRDPAGRLLGVVRRSFEAAARNKYRYPTGIDVRQLLYGYAEAVAMGAEVVVVGEGALDAVAVDEAGAVGLAIYGSHLSPEQVHLLNRLYPTTIIWAFDNDEAGRRATAHALDPTTGVVCTDQRVLELGAFNDVAQIPLEMRRRALVDWVKPA